MSDRIGRDSLDGGTCHGSGNKTLLVESGHLASMAPLGTNSLEIGVKKSVVD